MTTDSEEAAELQPLQPRSLIVSTYGLYARETGGWLSVSGLIRLMAQLGIDEPAVRSAISRLKRRGLLEPHRRDGVAGYGLSEQAREVLAEGDQRIFARTRAKIGDGWMLAVFSVPESERDKRHTLRSRLTWLGFGTTAAGVWIAPAHLYEETHEVLVRYGLSSYVDLFRAEYMAFGEVGEKVGQWWDLLELQGLYDQFLDAYTPVLARWKRRKTDRDSEAFADYVRALTVWRRLPFLDPGLAPELLPPNWHGVRAADLFAALRDRLEKPAHRYAAEVLEGRTHY